MWHTYLKLNGLTKGKKHLIWVLYCTIPYLVTDSAQCTCTFLRYRHSNYSLIITRSSATAEIARDAWNDNSRSLKVIRYCTNRRGIYDFLLPCELHNSGKTQHPKSGTARTAKIPRRLTHFQNLDVSIAASRRYTTFRRLCGRVKTEEVVNGLCLSKPL